MGKKTNHENQKLKRTFIVGFIFVSGMKQKHHSVQKKANPFAKEKMLTKFFLGTINHNNLGGKMNHWNKIAMKSQRLDSNLPSIGTSSSSKDYV